MRKALKHKILQSFREKKTVKGYIEQIVPTFVLKRLNATFYTV